MNIVFSGPSGSGKGTLTELLLKSSKFKKFTTCTTRKPRENEKNGFDYYFLDEEYKRKNSNVISKEIISDANIKK